MIVRPRQNWFQLLFVRKAIAPQLALMAAIGSLAVVAQGRVFGEKIPLDAALLTLFGLTLAIFIGFRNAASCERFDPGP